MMINCIIIDDEQHAIDVTKIFCSKIPNLEVIAEFTDSTEAALFVDVNIDKIDLVFLDIQMPRFTGIDFLKTYRFKNVILVTSYVEYALDSYEYGVVDYLLKPFSFDRFCLAVSKVHDKEEEVNEFLCLKLDRKKYIKLMYTEIKYIQGAQNYAVIYTMTEQIVVPMRLQQIYCLLPIKRFFRVHKSSIIHMDYFDSLTGKTIKIKYTDRTLLLGPSYREEFHKFIKGNRTA